MSLDCNVAKFGMIVCALVMKYEKMGVTWSNQFLSWFGRMLNLIPNLSGFFFCDCHGSHFAALGRELKFKLRRRWLLGIPDPYHLLANLINLLLNGESVEIYGLIVKLSGRYFEEIRKHHKNASTSVAYLRRILSLAIYKKIFKAMDDQDPHKLITAKFWQTLRKLFLLLTSNRTITNRDIKLIKGKFLIIY